MLDELIFVVAVTPGGGYTARALGASIFTETVDLEELRDAVHCHFDEGPRAIECRLNSEVVRRSL
jgi:hypothetical protein